MKWPVNYVFDPAVTDAQKGFRISAQWDRLTARQAMTATLDAAGLQLIEGAETGVARIVNRPKSLTDRALIPFGRGKPDTSPVIPRIRFEDVTLREALEFFRMKWPINLVFDSTITEEQRSARATVDWQNLTALQALAALLASHGLQLVENPETGVAKIINKTFFGPVVEREIQGNEQTLSQAFDFKNGKALILTREEFNRVADDGTDRRLYKTEYDWFKATGMDMFTLVGRKGFVLVGPVKEFKLGALPVAAWENPSESELLEALEHSTMESGTVLNGQVVPINTPVPLTYALKSGHNLGLLQITAVTQNPRGMKFRYKLVKSATAVNRQ
jgi:hypothetical protein